MPHTLEELERRTYIERHTEIARILGEAIDAEARCKEAEDLNKELVWDLEEARRALRED